MINLHFDQPINMFSTINLAAIQLIFVKTQGWKRRMKGGGLIQTEGRGDKGIKEQKNVKGERG